MSTDGWNPGKILEISGSYWKTCALHAAVKLDVFTAIGDEALDASSVARRIGADPDATLRLLNALAAMVLVKKAQEAFSNTPASRTYLSKASDRYVGFMVLHHHHLVESWSRLDESVRTGQPVRTRTSFGDPVRREAFLMGMYANAMLTAPHLVKSFDLTGQKRFLDMGGGPGTYAIHFCLNTPGLDATVYDLPTTRPFAEKTIAKFGLSDRIDFVEGDYVKGDLPGGYDVVWMSHILHAEGPDTCIRMIQKARKAATEGGRVMIHDFILDDAEDAPLFPALFSLNMLLGTGNGRSYSETRIREMMAEAGLVRIERSPFRGPTDSGVMIGYV